MNANKSDRELLELAAKAAGIEVTAIVADGIPHRFGGGYWNPLAYDGDALRLAVKLDLDVIYRVVGGRRVEVLPAGFDTFAEPYKGDPLAATRRAIVRAAAAVGEVLSRNSRKA